MLPLLFVILAGTTTAALGQINRAGGLSPPIHIDVSNPNVVKAVEGINYFYAAKGDNAVRRLVSVLEARQQMVSGILYHLTLEVAVGSQTEKCIVQVWQRVWLQGEQKRIVNGSPKCTPIANTPSTAAPTSGGFVPISVASEEVRMAAGFAEQEFNSQSKYINKFKAMNVVSAAINKTNEIVYTTKLTRVQMVETSCSRCNQYFQEPTCHPTKNAMKMECDFVVSIISWAYPSVIQSCKPMP